MAGGGTRFLWRVAVFTIIAMVVAGLGAQIFASRMPNYYRARALLILAPMKFHQQNAVVSGLESPGRRVNYLSVDQLDSLNMPDYRLLLTSEVIASQLRDKMTEIYKKAGLNPAGLSVQQLMGALDVRTKLLSQTSQGVQYQQVLELYITGPDPQVAAESANAWAQLAIDLAVKARTAAREGAVDYIQQQLDRVQKRLSDALAGIERVDTESNPSALEARLSALEEAKTQSLVHQSELAVQLAHLDAEVTALEKPASGAVDAQTLNTRRAARAGAQAERDALTQQAAALDPQITVLRGQYAKAQRARDEASAQADLLRKQADEMQVTLDSTVLAAADLQPEFKLASPAVPLNGPAGPQRSAIVGVAILLAALLTPLYFFGLHALRRYARSLDAAA